MAWTQEDIDRLKAGLANTGVLARMKFADEEYEFRTPKDALDLLAIMQAEVNAGAKNHRLASFSKGA